MLVGRRTVEVGARIDLEPISSTRAGVVTILRFRVRGVASVSTDRARILGG
jgi:hypothetical protein